MRQAAALLGLALALGAAPARAEPAVYDQTFVDAFAGACVPQRLSYEGTKRTALAAGWTEVAPEAHPELAAMLAISEREAKAPDLEATFDYAVYSRPITGADHYLVVSRATFIVGEADDPLNPWVYIGCYLYNFDAMAPIDPGPVTALIGNPIAQTQADMHLTGYAWGPPPAMPRTGDTYLTFVPDESQYKDTAGFSGLVLKFDTSEPDAEEQS